MDDLISRQAAIVQLSHNKTGDDDCDVVIQNDIETIKSLPSAQPERAIKDCRNCKFGDYNDHWNTRFCYYSGDCNNWDKWEPSAQPEIVQCKDCLMHGVCRFEQGLGLDGYCSQAKRRTNGVDS